jgi:lipopolysaccharide biosynthesis protein
MTPHRPPSFPRRARTLAEGLRRYALNDRDLRGGERGPATAVVLHLYYPESWALFADRLEALDGTPFDLFVTLPREHLALTAQIHERNPAARILETPNRGRDVLPFLKTARHLQARGYEHVLKLHSKRSTHRNDGAQRLAEILERLLPRDAAALGSVMAALGDPGTGVVGPASQYVTLAKNYAANRRHVMRALSHAHSPAVARRVDGNVHDFGFFAGTMFWARLDALAPVLQPNYGLRDFGHESGQIDGTFAHGLERVLCVSPEVQGRVVYEADGARVAPIPYASDNWVDALPPSAQRPSP